MSDDSIGIEGNLFALVMAGGRGTRFWPESTRRKPKQYLSLTGKEPLLTETLKRFDSLVAKEQRFIVTVEEQESLAAAAGKAHSHADSLIFEPSGRNTGPCILLSLASLEKRGAKEDDVVAIVPSDHVILNGSGFRESVKTAAMTALNHKSIVTIGIRPNFPHTGYGYIQRDAEVSPGVFQVKQFKEKPSREVAEQYLGSGEYFWNAGMFVATIKTLKEEFSKCSPEMYNYYEELLKNCDNEALLRETYNKLPEDSIDYAIMEKSDRVMVVEANFDWNDLGSWDALEGVVEAKKGNTIVGERDSYVADAKGNIIFAPGKYVAVSGVNNLIIVSNENALVVMPKERAQEIKDIVSDIKKNKYLEDIL